MRRPGMPAPRASAVPSPKSLWNAPFDVDDCRPGRPDLAERLRDRLPHRLVLHALREVEVRRRPARARPSRPRIGRSICRWSGTAASLAASRAIGTEARSTADSPAFASSARDAARNVRRDDRQLVRAGELDDRAVVGRIARPGPRVLQELLLRDRAGHVAGPALPARRARTSPSRRRPARRAASALRRSPAPAGAYWDRRAARRRTPRRRASDPPASLSKSLNPFCACRTRAAGRRNRCDDGGWPGGSCAVLQEDAQRAGQTDHVSIVRPARPGVNVRVSGAPATTSPESGRCAAGCRADRTASAAPAATRSAP